MREIKFRAWDKVTNEMSEPFILQEVIEYDYFFGGYSSCTTNEIVYME